jgi:hypothetical protein
MKNMPTLKPILLENFNMGGLSDSKWSGVKDSFYRLVGLDLHSQPGIVNVAQKLTKDSAATVSEFCKERVSCSNGSQYWGSSTSGKIWERTSGGTWRFVYTITPAAGGAAILGMAEYQGYIYIATESRLHRIAVSAADDNDWLNDIAEDWATFSITDASFHPMVEQNRVLYIGDGYYVAQVDAGTFSANALDIKTPLRIKSLGTYLTDILVGTWVSDNITKTVLLRWNTWSMNFSNVDSIPEVGINSFLPGDNVTFVQAGLAGNIYVYTGEVLELYKKIPGTYSPTAYGEVYPSSVANLNGNVLFGFSNGSGNPALQGVYQLGRNSRNYPYILDLPYPISRRSGTDFVTSSIEIGGMLAVGSDLYVAWKSGSNYGIDKLDYSNKLDGAYIEDRVKTIDREQLNNFSKIVAAYASLPANTDITLQYDKNYEGYTDTEEVTDTQRLIIESPLSIEANTLQTKITFTASGNNAPQLESAGIFLS